MKILFCNVAWMENYNGITEEDKPINGGAFVTENNDAAEAFNFSDLDGFCYGFVQVNGNMALESHFENTDSSTQYVDDVLVIWVATDPNGRSKIIGWYKNARVYREPQYRLSFIRQHNLLYRIKSKSKNCFLLPIKDRVFEIPRANNEGSGKGMGRANVWYAESGYARKNLIPKVISYINNYDGEYQNFIFSEKILNSKSSDSLSFDEHFNLGLDLFENQDFTGALKHFNSARSIKENVDVLFNIGVSLMNMNQYAYAKPLFDEIIKIEGGHFDTFSQLLIIYDFYGDYEKSLELAIYSHKCLNPEYEFYDDLNIYYSSIIFDISTFLNETDLSKEILETTIKHENSDLDKYQDFIKFMKKELLL